MDGRAVALIEAPFSGGAGIAGCEQAPAALRRAGLGAALRGAGCRVREAPLAFAGCGGPGRATLPQLVDACRRVRGAVGAALDGGALPILIGGDHSLSIGSLAAVARHCRERRRPLQVLWFDAHADFNTFATSPSGNVHGMPAAVVCGVGDPALLAVGETVPMVAPSRLRLIGVRAVDTGERALLRAHAIEVRTMAEVQRQGLGRVVSQALRQAAAEGAHLHVSIDIDVMDPAIAPGVGSPEPDGVALEAMRAALQEVAASGLLGSLDVMELNPLRDVDGATTRLAIGLTEAALARPETRRYACAL